MDVVPINLDNGTTRNILVIVDYFTKYVVTKVIGEATTSNITRAIRTTVLWEHSTPRIIISDGGTQFTCDDFHQQANGQVERTIQTFKPILISKLKSNNNLKLSCKLATTAINKYLVSSTTGVTAHKALRNVQDLKPFHKPTVEANSPEKMVSEPKLVPPIVKKAEGLSGSIPNPLLQTTRSRQRSLEETQKSKRWVT